MIHKYYIVLIAFFPAFSERSISCIFPVQLSQNLSTGSVCAAGGGGEAKVLGYVLGQINMTYSIDI